MIYLLKKMLAKIFLLVLLCSSFAFTQYSYINYNGSIHRVDTKSIFFTVKAGYYNDELFEKLKNPPYFPTYSIDSARTEDNYVFLKINGDEANINILEHYYKFEKEEFVERVVPYASEIYIDAFGEIFYDVKGQVLNNGLPLANYIVRLVVDENVTNYHGIGKKFNSISDENGNYIFTTMWSNRQYNSNSNDCVYTLSVKNGDITYDETFVLNGNKVVNLDISDGNITLGVDYSKDIPITYSLSQNYPNPFNPSTNFKYSVPNKTDVRIVVYDLFGREIKTLVNESKEAGTYNITWNGRDHDNRQVSTGVYFYKMQEAGGFQKTMKMMLMK